MADDRERNVDAWDGPPPNAIQKPEPREAQGRARDEDSTQGQAESPVDSMHVDAPKQKNNARGHREGKQRR